MEKKTIAQAQKVNDSGLNKIEEAKVVNHPWPGLATALTSSC